MSRLKPLQQPITSLSPIPFSTWWDAGSTPVRLDQVRATLSFQNNARTLLSADAALDAQLDAAWQTRVKANPTLYNGTKFRLAGIRVNTSDTPTETAATITETATTITETANTITDTIAANSSVRLVLDIGICDYQTYVTRNQSSTKHLHKLGVLGTEQYNDPRAFLSDPLGVGVFLLTKDDDIVLIERSRHTGELAGWYDLPGGHPEPSNAGFTHSLADLSSMPAAKTDELEKEWQTPIIAREIFGSVVDEVIAEINLAREDLSASSLELLSIMRQSQSGGRPCALFRMRTSLHSDQVKAQYVVGGEESDESNCMVLVPVSVVASSAGECRRVDKCGNVTAVPFSDLVGKLTPSAWAVFSKLIWTGSDDTQV